MECSVCEREITARRKGLCGSCVQASLYKPRIDKVQAILSNEKAHAHVEAVVRPGNDGVLAALPEDADWDAITVGISTYGNRKAEAEKERMELRIEDISEKAKELQQQIEDHKRYVAEQKKLHQSRREAIKSGRGELARHRTEATGPVQADIKKAKRQLEKMHTRTAEAREYLCKEVGTLCGLQRAKDSKGKSLFYLAGLPMPNLKDLNALSGRLRGDRFGVLDDNRPVAEPHELVSASFDNVCLFLGVCCYYLSVRMPAEIILPTVDFPHSAVMQREASYKAGELRYPGTPSNNPSPAQSRTLVAGSERGKPRPLQLRKQLLALQTHNSKTYELFLEGAMLLAYDIAWLCRTQGITEGTPSFDDVCDIGRNLYSLAGPRSRPGLDRRATGATNKTDTGTGNQFGRFSHASVTHALAGHGGIAIFAPDAWRVSVTTLTDKLKSYLRSEASRSEWHVVDYKEWNNMEHDPAVMVGDTSAPRRPENARGPAMSVMTVSPHDGADDDEAPPTAKGGSGWTKLRGRGGGDA